MTVPGGRTLVMSRGRSLRLLAVGAVFTAAGIWMIATGSTVLGVITVAFFGVLGLPLIGIQAMRPPTLALDADGFRMTQPGRPALVRRWTECGPFRAWAAPGARSAAVSYSTSRTDKAALRAANRALAADDDEAIPPGFGGLSARELAGLMNAYRSAATG